jgi:hypothetical protein
MVAPVSADLPYKTMSFEIPPMRDNVSSRGSTLQESEE